MKPDARAVSRALGSWRQWGAELRARPVVEQPLSEGLSNHSFLLDSAGAKMVLRMNSDRPPLAGIRRRNETEIWKSASSQGIAPALLYLDGRSEFLVSDYIENRLPARPRENRAVLDQVFGLLDRCHSLGVEASAINYSRHIDLYWQKIESGGQLKNPELIKQRGPMRSVLDSLISSGAKTGLCHHDPVIANFVGDVNRLYLIDWEYAARGILAMDYAALGIEWGIDDNTIMERTDIHGDILTAAKAVYQYLCALWKEVPE